MCYSWGGVGVIDDITVSVGGDVVRDGVDGNFSVGFIVVAGGDVGALVLLLPVLLILVVMVLDIVIVIIVVAVGCSKLCFLLSEKSKVI